MIGYNELREGQNFYENGYKQGYADAKAKFEKPQGEWIIKPKENSQSAILICNKCNHFIPVTIDKNFCPNCGSDMKIKNISPDSGIREFDKKFADLIVFNDQPQRQLKSSDVHEDV